MLARGARIGAGEIGILAAQGISSIEVNRKPRVAILSTGDELRDVGEPLVPGSIVNSNAYALAAMIRETGCEPVVLPNVPDDLDKTIDALREGLKHDVLLTVGGVSVGDYDFVKEAFDKVGISAGFWKVRIKPGKPLIFGMHEKIPVVGLPGNPMSAMVTFEALVRPGLRKLLGDPKPFRMRHSVSLACDHRHGTGRLELARARIANENGKLVATPRRLQDSGSLTSWVDVDALLLLAEDRATFSTGEIVSALLLRDDTGSASSPFL
jgi:molybdopterin molybdotransferase